MSDSPPASDSYVSTLRNFLCADGVVGSSERWWSGKQSFDFMQKSSTSKSSPKVTKSKEDRVERLLQELSVPDSYEEKAIDDVHAVERGLNFMMQLATNDVNFHSFGSEIFQTFYDISTFAEEPLRRFALLRTEVVAQMWLQKYPSLSCVADEDDLSTDDIMDFVQGIYTLERVGIGHNSKEEVRATVQECSIKGLFGVCEASFSVEDQQDDETLLLPLRSYANALTYTYYSEKTGIDIKVDFATVLSLLPLYRPYENYDVLEKNDYLKIDAYYDQLTMICCLVHVMSNFGELCLSPSLFPQEHKQLSDPVHISRAIEFDDVHLLGEVCHCLIVFGHTEETSTDLADGLNYLRCKQLLSDGSWPTRDQRMDPYTRYHATMCAVYALSPKRFRGFGPSEPSLLDDLHSMKGLTRVNMNRQDDNLLENTPTFIDSPLHGLSSFSHLNNLYQLSAESVSHEMNMSAQIYGISRLQCIVKTQQNMQKFLGPLLISKGPHKRKRKRSSDLDYDSDKIV